jgi:hypothetical protein
MSPNNSFCQVDSNKDEYFECIQQGTNKAKPIFLDGMA